MIGNAATLATVVVFAAFVLKGTVTIALVKGWVRRKRRAKGFIWSKPTKLSSLEKDIRQLTE